MSRRCLTTLTWRLPWTIPVDTRSALVTAEHLAKTVDIEDVVVLDSTVLIASETNGYDGYVKQKIPGAGFFDLDLIGDTAFGPAPHNLPTVDRFCKEMDQLGIPDPHTKIVLYDQLGIFSAPRAWFTFIAMGHDEDKVFVLDGGLPAWKRGGFGLDISQPCVDDAADSSSSNSGMWQLRHGSMQWGLQDMQEWMDKDSEAKVPLLDARSSARFHGAAPEPRAGMRGGHIPGSVSMPFSELLQSDGTLRPRTELHQIFAQVGVEGLLDGTPAVALTCGSGLTAAIIALALNEIGLPATRQTIYDGSWSEWGGRSDTPIVTE